MISAIPNKRQKIPKGQLEMDISEKLATQGTQDDDKQTTNTTQYNMCWTSLCANKQK